MRNKINVIDVGCAHSLDKEWRRKKENNLEKINFFIGFDPFGKSQTPYINKEFPKNIIYNYAVFDKEGEYPFYICNKSQCSSLFPPNPKLVKKYVKIGKKRYGKEKHIEFHRMDIKKIIKVKCIRLDSIISRLKINFDFIKVDTQGADFQVLKSLGKYLTTQIVGVKSELFFQSLYKNITLYKVVNEFLRKKNFKCVKKFGNNKFVTNFLYIRQDENKKEQIKIIKNIYKLNKK